jgi:dihydroflavonol-4-reductase
MKKIAFVTGSAGFLGRNLMEVLRKEDWQVHVLLRSGTPKWMQEWPNLQESTGALDDADAVLRAMPEQCDAVFHLAGNTSSWVGDESAIYRDNVVATQNVISAALKRSARRLVMTSTLGVFDTRHGTINEQTPLMGANSKNPYLRTKLQADTLLDAAQASGLSVVRVHPGHIPGKHTAQAGSIFSLRRSKTSSARRRAERPAFAWPAM